MKVNKGFKGFARRPVLLHKTCNMPQPCFPILVFKLYLWQLADGLHLNYMYLWSLKLASDWLELQFNPSKFRMKLPQQ